MVNLIGDNSKGKVLAILSDNNYEIEFLREGQASLTITIHITEIEKYLLMKV